MLVSSLKFQSKAEEVVREGLDKPLKLEIVQKHLAGSESVEQVQLDNSKDDAGGMMLYTSGTTSRPVGSPCPTTNLVKLIIYRKACFSPTQSSQRKANHSSKPGNTPPPTTSYTFCPSITFTEP